MPAEKPSKLPPIRVARAVDAVRRRLRRVEQRMVPAPAVLSDGPRSAEEIARKVDADPDAVRRLLRMLASRGVFTQHGDGRFALTPMADALRADAPTSVRGIVLFFGHPNHWEHWGHLPYSVQPAGPASTRCAASRCSSGWTTSRNSPPSSTRE